MCLQQLRIRLRPAARCWLMRHVRRATHRPPYPPTHCDCLQPLVLCSERSDRVINTLTLPTSLSCSFASYNSNAHLKLVSDKSSSLLRVQLDPIDGQRAAVLKRMRRGVASGVPHAEVGHMHRNRVCVIVSYASVIDGIHMQRAIFIDPPLRGAGVQDRPPLSPPRFLAGRCR